MKLSELKLNPNNPRFIRDEKFKKLVHSIKQDDKFTAEMMKLRPIVIDDNNMILAGNMRYRAFLEIGKTEIPDEWIKRASDMTEEQRQRFIVEDNLAFGETDFDVLANNFKVEDLLKWGFDEAELLKDIGLDRVEDIEVDENRLFVLTVEPPEGPKLKERMAFYCESFEDYTRIKDYFEKSKSELDVSKLLEMI